MGGPLVGLAVLLLITAGQASAIVSNLFLSHWVHLPYEQEQEDRNIYIYLALVALVAFLAVRVVLASVWRAVS